MNLPPLKSLSAFEAAARHMSFRAAADELNVTPSAISHQIRGLEETLGTRLFHRDSKQLTLTAEGRALQPDLADGFQSISRAIRKVVDSQRSGVLTISMVSTFAMRWFLPRLPRFQVLHPDIEIRISTTMRTVDFSREDIDAAVRHGKTSWAGLRCDKLFALETVPVCSPDLLTAANLHDANDLTNHILLHATARPDDWRNWFSANGIPFKAPPRELTFETTNFTLAAAIKGLGFAIADRHLVAEDVDAGRLVIPFERPSRLDEFFFFVCPEENATKPKMTVFREWLLQEASSGH